MGINRGRVLHKAKIYAAMFIIVCAIVLDMMLVHYVQDCKRQQARYNLEHTVGCMGRYERVKGTLDDRGMEICSRYMRTSITGDMYILDLETLRFEYDGSEDIPQDKVLYFTKESLGDEFKDWKSAEQAIKHITSGMDSNHLNKVWYNYDGAREWIEYKVYTTREGVQLVVVQGTQSDEALEAFMPVRASTGILVSIYVLWLLTTSIRGRRIDD